ncbi:MAG: hypothetical protein HLUCCO07_03895 [Rhodobacteraceae bacterium HLUCCO07]|nr:MAG: hypothetical protein HLUCCO07_03895 [Rhodobacteraceae bacterium HLUCCO07]
MKQIILAILIVVGMSARDANADEARNMAVENVITRQIEAFRADDVERAFEFASPTIQRIFRNPQVFGHMVQHGYPMVWRAGDVEFLELRMVDGQLKQKVGIRDTTGDTHLLDYHMIKQDGTWKINGVELLKLPGMAV